MGALRWEDRAKRLKKLDAEQKPYRNAVRSAAAHDGWLREIRLALGVPVLEVARKMGVHRSEVFRMEERETGKRMEIGTLERMADALDCRLVYAVVPKKGTFEDLSLKRAWKSLFGPEGEREFRRLLRQEAREEDE